jgi:hypothetical protein
MNDQLLNTESKRRGRPPGSGNPRLKLTCLMTGKQRNSNINYLTRKAERHGVDVDVVANNYVSKEALKQFAEDPRWQGTARDLILRLNGGTRIRKKKNES